MFSSEHAIWKFASAGDELDDWLPYAEDLIRKWAGQNSNEVEFEKTFDIILAALLLEDELLPASAKAAFARLMLETIDEVREKKLRMECLHISPPKPGRKNERDQIAFRLREARALIEKGMPRAEAYKVVAEKYFKSVDTIRRDCERAVKNRRKRKGVGENDK